MPWVVTRVVVLGVLALAHVLVSHTHPAAAVAARVHQGLLGWDAGWYQAIAAHGYGGVSHQALRFWPLLPLLGRAVAVLPGVTPGIGLLVVANVSQLAGLAVLACLAASDTGDPAVGRRAAWLASVLPAAFVSVMGYAEPTLLLLSAGALLALRRGRWWWAAAAGVAAGLCRPLGLALVAPAVVEAFRPWWQPWWAAARRSGHHPQGGDLGDRPVAGEPGAWQGSGTPDARQVSPGTGGRYPVDAPRTWLQAGGRGASPRIGPADLAGRLAAVVAPVAGFGAFLVYVGARFGDALAPIRVQQQANLHGRLADPVVTLFHDAVDLLHGHHLDEGLHVPWVLLAVVMLVVAARRLPASSTLFAAAVLVAALSGPNLDSFERYGLSAFPLVIAGALCTASPRVERPVLVLAGAGLVAYALLAFMNVLVP